MTRFWLIFLFFHGAPARALPPDSFAPAIDPTRGALAKLDPGKPGDFAEILSRVSAALVGRPYELGPLGEGAAGAEDKDPLYRLDAFDCTTFIETVMANAYCFRSGARVKSCLAGKMQSIRYGGDRVLYRERNHIPELDWLPHNVSRGYLEDLHASLFPKEWKSAAVTIDRGLWLASKGFHEKASDPGPAATRVYYLPVAYFFAKAALPAEAKTALDEKLAAAQKEIALKRAAPGISEEEKHELEKQTFRAELEYLRAAYVPLPERLREIPSGTILNLVHAPIPDAAKARLTPLISHQGLILQGTTEARIRHAAPNIGHVSDQSLADYLLRYVRSAHFRGISLFRILPGK